MYCINALSTHIYYNVHSTGGSDFVVENSECCFKAGEKEAECEIKVNEDSVTEGDEEFTLSLFAKEGQCVCNTSIKATISESLGVSCYVIMCAHVHTHARVCILVYACMCSMQKLYTCMYMSCMSSLCVCMCTRVCVCMCVLVCLCASMIHIQH